MVLEYSIEYNKTMPLTTHHESLLFPVDLVNHIQDVAHQDKTIPVHFSSNLDTYTPSLNDDEELCQYQFDVPSSSEIEANDTILSNDEEMPLHPCYNLFTDRDNEEEDELYPLSSSISVLHAINKPGEFCIFDTITYNLSDSVDSLSKSANHSPSESAYFDQIEELFGNACIGIIDSPEKNRNETPETAYFDQIQDLFGDEAGVQIGDASDKNENELYIMKNEDVCINSEWEPTNFDKLMSEICQYPFELLSSQQNESNDVIISNDDEISLYQWYHLLNNNINEKEDKLYPTSSMSMVSASNAINESTEMSILDTIYKSEYMHPNYIVELGIKTVDSLSKSDNYSSECSYFDRIQDFFSNIGVHIDECPKDSNHELYMMSNEDICIHQEIEPSYFDELASELSRTL